MKAVCCARCKTHFDVFGALESAYSCASIVKNGILTCGYGSLYDFDSYGSQSGFTLTENEIYCDGCIHLLIEMGYLSIMKDWQGPPSLEQWQKQKEDEELIDWFLDQMDLEP